MTDKAINCVACGRKFTWSDGEQRFYRERGLVQPKRCPSCRAQRRSEGRTAGPDRSMARRPSGHGARGWLAHPVNRLGAILICGSALGAIAVNAATEAVNLVTAWLLAINVVTFLAYAYDKVISTSGRTRVPERVLLALGLAGGSLGAIVGVFGLRHKTSKLGFQARFLGIVIVQAILVACYYLLIKPQISG